MLDNIIYEAQLCKISIDFGPEFKTEPLMTAQEGGQQLQTSSQLACHDFDHNCRWRNGGGVLSHTPLLRLIICLLVRPSDVSSTWGIHPNFQNLVHKGVQMSICVLNLDMEEKECQKISLARSPAPSIHRFESTEKFWLYAFRIDQSNADFDNFVIIDDIEYEGTMCSEAINALDLGGEFYTTPLLSSLLNRPIHSASDLACDFSRRGLDCLWANLDENGGEDSAKWEIGLGTIDNRKFESLTNRLSIPESDLAIAKFLTRNSTAVLVSETIRCLSHDGSTLSLQYWRTGEASLKICIIRRCGDRTSERIFVDIPTVNEPIRIALRADSINGLGIVAVDDILIEGKVCPNVAYSSKSGFSNRARPNFQPVRGKQDFLSNNLLHNTLPQTRMCAGC
uniref:MAM domain-containing protein n=1 Tax=Ditylenchus dipsaci TaxID=166011 RepID=A0A915ERT2_9BILA